MRFLLGTHEPSWLGRSEVSLFLSAVRLRRYKRLPRAIAPWALDSGGFSELSIHGRWRISAEQYAAEVRHWMATIGMLMWAAIQDWMCEPWIIAKTGLTVRVHQLATIASLRRLRELAPEVPWVPVVQGWTLADYLQHVEDYAALGFDLTKEPIVGVGSVCRRQGTHEGAEIMRVLSALGLRIHAFGVKTDGLALYGDRIESADSMAWSYVARRRKIRLPGCAHKTCSNCFRFAMQWAGNLKTKPAQVSLPW